MSRGAERGFNAQGVAGTGPAADFGAQFGVAFRRLWLVAYGVVRNRALADDVVQEAAIIGLDKFSTFEPGTSFASWMAKIVRYVALNQGRAARRRRAGTLDHELDVAAPRAAPAGAVQVGAGGRLPAHQEIFDDAVMAALAKVGETPRVCLLLRVIENLEYAEIAQLLGIPEGTAMSHVHRTRQLLRTELAHMAPGAGVKS